MYSVYILRRMSVSAAKSFTSSTCAFINHTGKPWIIGLLEIMLNIAEDWKTIVKMPEGI